MRSKVEEHSEEAEQTVRDIRRATRRQYSAELECAVCAAAQAMLADHAAIAQASEQSGIDAGQSPAVLTSAQGWIERLRSRSETASALAELIQRVELGREGLQVALKLPTPAIKDANQSTHLDLVRLVALRMKRRGVEMRMVLEGDATPARVSLPLLKAIARAHRWCQDLIAGDVRSVSELARREQLDRRSVHRLLRLGFLSPRIVEAVAEGRQPPELTVVGLMRRTDLPLLWRAQERALAMR